MKLTAILFISLFFAFAHGADSKQPETPAPTSDRVGFPKDYTNRFQVLRVVNKVAEHKVVTIYGNNPASSVTNSAQLPYPYGSVIVMETAIAVKDSQGNAALDSKGNLRKDRVTGLHVMRREKGFGEDYGNNRAGEWEYVEYRPDGSYLTPPEKSFSCAECHLKAGAKRDFVYRARLAETSEK